MYTELLNSFSNGVNFFTFNGCDRSGQGMPVCAFLANGLSFITKEAFIGEELFSVPKWIGLTGVTVGKHR